MRPNLSFISELTSLATFSATYVTDRLSPSTSVLCCSRHLPQAVRRGGVVTPGAVEGCNPHIMGWGLLTCFNRPLQNLKKFKKFVSTESSRVIAFLPK